MDYYFYLDENEEEQGPVKVKDLLECGVTESTKVREENTESWQTAETIEGLFQKPNNLLVWSILSTIFCCVLTGIPAIVYSSRVNILWRTKDYAGSIHAAKGARIWCLVSLSLFLLAIYYCLFLARYKY